LRGLAADLRANPTAAAARRRTPRRLKVVQRAREALGPGIEYRRTEVVGPSVGGELIWGWRQGDGLRARRDPDLHLVPLRVAVRHRGDRSRPCMTSSPQSAVRDLPTRIQPDDIGGDPDDRRVFDQRHGGDLRPRPRVDARKYRTMPFRELINLALNETLSRTILTVSTVALGSWRCCSWRRGAARLQHRDAVGHRVGTYPRSFIAAPLLYYVQPDRRRDGQGW